MDPTSEEQILIEVRKMENTNDILSGISMICAIIVLVTLSLISLYDSKLVNRVSLKLCSAIAVVDVLRSISFTGYIYIKDEGFLCKFNGAFINFIIVAHMLLSVGIALNLQLLFLNRAIYKGWWQWFYWFLGFGVPLILTLIVACLDGFGKDPVTGACFFKELYTPNVIPHVLIWVAFLGPNVIGCIYCLSIALLTIYSLKDSKGLLFRLKMKSNNNHSNSNSSEDGMIKKQKLTVSEDTVSLLIRRITIYCIIPTITQSGCIVGIMYGEIHGEVPFWMFYFDIVATHLSGILSLVGFLYDPALKNSLNYIKMDLLTYKSKDSNEFHFQQHSYPWVCKFFKAVLLRSTISGLNPVENIKKEGPSTPIQNIIVQVKEISDDATEKQENYSMNEIESSRSRNTIESYDTCTNLNSKSKRKNYFNAVSGL